MGVFFTEKLNSVLLCLHYHMVYSQVMNKVGQYYDIVVYRDIKVS